MEKQHLEFLRLRVFQIVLLLPSNLVLRFFRLSSSSCVFQIGSSDRLQIFMRFPNRFFRSSLDRSSSSFGFGSSVLQIIFIFMLFPDQFFRSSSDLHAFSRSVLQIIFALQILLQNSSLRNSSSTWINYSTSALELEFLSLFFVTELELHRLEMLVS